MNVFISFAKEDKDRVQRLAEILRLGGGRDWRYVYDLTGARDWRTEIQYSIDQCEVFLFVITEHSNQSEWCQKELQHAALSQKPIVTVIYDAAVEIPYPLDTIQYVLFEDNAEFGARLVRAVQDPHPISQEKILADWVLLGGGPIGYSPISASQIPIPKVARKLTDLEKDDYLHTTFVEIRAYFESALKMFRDSDTRIDTRMRMESETGFKCQVFLDGDVRLSCMIWISDALGLKGIAYNEAYGQMYSSFGNSYNELAQVVEHNGKPALRFTLGFGIFGHSSDCKVCDTKKAAECLWTYFVRHPLN